MRCRMVDRRTWLAAACGLTAQLVTRWPNPARATTDRWPHERQLGVVHIHADFALGPYTELLDEVGHLDQLLARTLDVPAPREPVHLVLFQQKSTYQAYLRQYFPRVPYRRALYIKDRGPGMVLATRGPEFDVDLRHEVTHAVLHASQINVPLWLDEGLAEYFELPAGQRAYGHEHLNAVRTYVRSAPAARLEDLQALDDLTQMGQAEYQRAWAWVHFCLHGPDEARGELTRYLSDLTAGSSGAPLSERLRRHWPDLENRFVQHFRHWV